MFRNSQILPDAITGQLNNGSSTATQTQILWSQQQLLKAIALAATIISLLKIRPDTSHFSACCQHADCQPAAATSD